MDIFTTILIIICVLFAVYKLICRMVHHFNNLSKKRTNIEIADSGNINIHTYSHVSFDFPNVQSETDMEIINSGSNLCDKQEKIIVKEYCEF